MSFDVRLWQHSADCKPWCIDDWPEDARVCYCKTPSLPGVPLSAYGSGIGDTASDGRPLYVGTMAYEAWIKYDRRSTTEKDRT